MVVKVSNIPNRLKNPSKEHPYVAGAVDIVDDALGKPQSQVNQERIEDIAEETQRAQAEENLLQGEINALSRQNYVTVGSYSGLPDLGAVDTIYRVSSWDGTQVDATKYAEYAWNNTGIDQGEYVLLDVKTQVGEVFDISLYKAVGGVLATFADLSAALDGGNNVPAGVRQGGMSVKFIQGSVQSIDNKYIHYNLVANEFTTDVTKWAIDDNGVYVDDPEHIDIELDNEEKLLESRNIDGTKEFHTNVEISGKAILKETEIKEDVSVNGKTTVKDFEINSEAIHIEQDENPEYMEVELDNEERIIAGRKSEGTKVENIGVETPKVSIDGVNIETINDPEGRMDIGFDAGRKIVNCRSEDGVLHENVGIETPHLLTDSLELTKNGMSEFQQALKDSGFDVVVKCDWSDASAIEIPIPRYAQVNISNADGTASWPTTKKDDLKYFMEFWDMQGNYFKKEIILNAQGNSTLAWEKKNGSIDICNNNGWDDEDTFSIKFGNWVPQDSFHLKAWYIDAFRGRANIAYELMTEIMNYRPYANQRPWHKLVEPDTTIYTGVGNIKYELNEEPLCVPDGFPCSVYLNGTFYGIYTFNLKKHRDNYALDKANKNNIHVDGDYYVTGVFGGTIDWQEMEIRNPKNLVYAEVHTDAKGKATFKYDADITNGQDEIAGIDKNYDGAWAAGSYAVGRVVLHNDNYFINQVADNTAEPILQDLSGNKNTAKEPDFKNKTGCGWINCTNTVHVKQKFQRLSGFHDAMVANPTKATFESYIDVDTCIDYLLHSNFLHNVDSINKNTQWVTYDGNIWYPFTYDCDQAFGLSTPGDHIRRYDYEYGNLDLIIGSDDLVDTTTNSPYPWIFTLYKNEIDARYKELVEAGILTVEHVVGMVIDYVKRVGLANYKKELDKWPATPSYRDATQYDNKGFYESVMRVQKYLTAQKAELDNYFNLDI